MTFQKQWGNDRQLKTKWDKKKRNIPSQWRIIARMWRRVIRRVFATLHAATLRPSSAICDTQTHQAVHHPFRTTPVQRHQPERSGKAICGQLRGAGATAA